MKWKGYEVWLDDVIISVETTEDEAIAYCDELHEQNPHSYVDVIAVDEYDNGERIYGYSY